MTSSLPFPKYRIRVALLLLAYGWKPPAVTRAAIVIHYGGYVADVSAWRGFVDSEGLKLIEDAAHAPGVGICWSTPTTCIDFAGPGQQEYGKLVGAEGPGTSLIGPHNLQRILHLQSILWSALPRSLMGDFYLGEYLCRISLPIKYPS